MSETLPVSPMEVRIFLPGIPPSKKNSRIIIHNKAGRPFSIPSSEYKKWTVAMAKHVRLQYKFGEIDWPVVLHCIFFCKHKRKYDLENKISSVQDLLVDCHVIQDDNRFILKKIIAEWQQVECEEGVQIVLT